LFFGESPLAISKTQKQTHCSNSIMVAKLQKQSHSGIAQMFKNAETKPFTDQEKE